MKALPLLLLAFACAAPRPLVITEDYAVVDLRGAHLRGAPEGADPDSFTGVGILVDGADDVIIRNARISGFKVAIQARNCRGLVIEDCDLSGNFAQRLRSTPEAEDGADWLWPHENDGNEWMNNYGAAVYLEGCRHVVVRRVTARNQQNGFLMTRCERVRVYDCDASYNSGWGLAMYRTTESVVSRNRFDYCVRGYSHGVYDRGQDSAGILVFEQCSNNVFARNSATHSGDGFFLYAGNETLHETGEGGCNNNLVIGNDFSYAVANGIEATFSGGNVFAENRLNSCNYGVWAGYSYQSRIEGNTIRDNRVAGIAIEHGNGNRIAGNTIESNPIGVHFWWDDDADLLNSAYARTHDTNSTGNVVTGNAFVGNAQDVRVENSDPPMEHVRAPEAIEEPYTAGTQDPFRETGGMETIVVGEWGPIDVARSGIDTTGSWGLGEATIRVFGSDPFRVTGAEGVVVEPMSGTAPATLTVRPARPFEYTEYEVRVRTGGREFESRGVLMNAHWAVRHFRLNANPQYDPAAWERLIQADPVLDRGADAIDFRWAEGGPAGMEADFFGTVAFTEIDLPAGRYEFRTVSDDGVRLRVGGETIIDNWTIHGPAENVGTHDHAGGRVEMEIQHWEWTGYAILTLRFRRVADPATGS